MASRIEDYGLIGDLQTAALVSRDGSIDWLCFPRFDSGACFAALVGDGGERPLVAAPRRRDLRGSSGATAATRLVLETELEIDDGAVRLIDFMPPRGEAPDVVRIVEGVAGPRPHADRTRDPVRLRLDRPVGAARRRGHASRSPGPDALLLASPGRARRREHAHRRGVHVAAGERVPFVLTWYPSNDDLPAHVDAEAGARRDRGVLATSGRAAARTEARTATRSIRSLVTLKALTYAPTGGIVAAPTTSLPECLGGVRNWDYRYCWLRDATLTLLSLIRAGYDDEARAWRDWLLRAIAGSPGRAAVMYGLAGERRIAELELPWLAGLRGLAAGPRSATRRAPAPARRLRRGPRRAVPGALRRARRRRTTPGRSAARAARVARGRSGASPTRGSGRCAARAATSPTRR